MGAGKAVSLLALVLLFALQTTPASADKKATHHSYASGVSILI
jgi:hypothetical protein